MKIPEEKLQFCINLNSCIDILVHFQVGSGSALIFFESYFLYTGSCFQTNVSFEVSVEQTTGWLSTSYPLLP